MNEKLDEIISNIFGVAKEEITDSLSPETLPNWDSMSYLLFIAEVEKVFGVLFTLNEVMEVKNLGDIKKCLRSKGLAL